MVMIYRYEVPVDDEEHTFRCGVPLAVGCRHANMIEFWAEPSDEDSRTFRVVGTGQPFPGDVWTYRGSAVEPRGVFVWHLLERTSMDSPPVAGQVPAERLEKLVDDLSAALCVNFADWQRDVLRQLLGGRAIS